MKLRHFFKKAFPCLLAVALLFGCAEKREKSEVYYFYEEVCASCDAEGAFYETVKQKTGDLELPEGHTTICLNTFTSGEETWQQICEERGIPEESRSLPMLITPAGWVSGEETVAENLRHLLCESYGLEDKKTFWYYYRPDCPDCQRIELELNRAFSNQPELSLIRTDTTDPEPKAAFKARLTEMGVPEEEWQVPFLIRGDESYLSGDGEISERLDEFLTEHKN